MIAEKVKNALAEIAGGNPFGEKITLVAATKTRTPEEINEAIAAGHNGHRRKQGAGIYRKVRRRARRQPSLHRTFADQ